MNQIPFFQDHAYDIYILTKHRDDIDNYNLEISLKE